MVVVEERRRRRGEGEVLDREGSRLDACPRLAVLVQLPEDELHLALDLGELGFRLVVVDGGGEGDACGLGSISIWGV